MTYEEALNLALKSGVDDAADVAKKLVEMFPGDVSDFTKDDFINSDKPYELAYFYRFDKFEQDKLLRRLTEQARKVKVTNFRGLWKSFLKSKPADDAQRTAGEVTNFPGQPIKLIGGDWVCDEKGVRTATENGGFVYACPHPIMPIARLRNVDTGVEKMKIAFAKTQEDGEFRWQTAVCDRSTVSNASKIVQLSDLGVAVTSETAKSLVKFLYDMERENIEILPEIQCVTRLGWVGGESGKFVPYDTKNVIFDGEAEYKKRYDAVRQRGELTDWIAFIDKNVRHNKQPAARIALAASCASVLIEPLHCNNFWVHLWGESETAKTVLMMCAASVWGNPTISDFITTFNSTYVGNEKNAALCGSLPYFLDELQIVDSRRDMDSVVYMLMEGCGRTRGTKAGGLDVTPRWKLCVQSTGERPITSTNSNGGVVNRVIECECKEKFFENPREVATFVQHNYGTMGRMFIAFLRNNGGERLKLADKWLEEYTNAFVDKGTTQKQAQAAALIMTADRILCENFFDTGTQLTVDEMLPYLKTQAEVSANPRAYDYICDYIAANQTHFRLAADRPTELWGLFANDGASVYIINSVFERVCSEAGYNVKAFKSWLDREGLLTRGSDGRFAVKKRIGMANPWCILLRLTDKTATIAAELPDF